MFSVPRALCVFSFCACLCLTAAPLRADTDEANLPPPASDATTDTNTIHRATTPPEAHPPYLLQPGDVLDIKLRFNPELNEQIVIPPDGLISTSMAEDVPAAGHTVKALRNTLKKRYAKELKDPYLSVILKSFAPNRVYVTGEVNTPGEFVTTGPNITLLQAIARAGGLKNSAGTENIILIRHTPGAPVTLYPVQYENAASGADPAADIELSAYDVVFVPRSDIADAYVYFQQFVQQFIPVSFGTSYQLNPQNNGGR